MNKSLLIFSAAVLAALTGIATAYAEESVSVEPLSQDAAPASAVAPAANAQQPSPPTREKIDLETAYKREYAFLEVQKRELTDRLKKYQASTQNEIRELNNKIAVMDRASVERSARIDQLNTLLAEAERGEAAAMERGDALEITYAQAEATLKNHDKEIPSTLMESKGNDTTKVAYLFDQALILLRELGATQTTSGNFFLE
ncbi:MAG TPA: flagellar motor protein MotA, partial [Nitrosomonas sp.]|nr:flagellar motor protein MotA [Nitrosomonas sp.]